MLAITGGLRASWFLRIEVASANCRLRQPGSGAGDHLVLLMGAEVEKDMQVLELAGRALEDQVSKRGHAQVSATLQQEERDLSSAHLCLWALSPDCL